MRRIERIRSIGRGITALAALGAATFITEAGAANAPPPLLSLTGLYAAGVPLRVSPEVAAFSPQYPLWSDGAGKSRWIYLPPGSTIDGSDIDSWDFPVGTRLWKEFAWAGRKVETRFLWRATREEWVFATYLWNDDQSDASLAPDEGIRDYVEIAPGRRHSIPGTLDCRTCHEGVRSRVLGFTALQLSPDRDPLAPHAETPAPGMVNLNDLIERGALVPPRPDLIASPPRILASTPRGRAALGYLSANCGGCHNTEGSLESLEFVLRQPAEGGRIGADPASRTAIGRISRYFVPAALPGRTLRIAPGSPEHSSILYRMSSRRPSSQMPPLGSAMVDQEAVALLRGWIAEDLRP